MAIAFVQDVAQNIASASGNTVVLTLAAGKTTTVGNTLILWGHGGSIHATISTITDSKGNTWTVDKKGTVTVGNVASIASANLTAALVAGDTITITFGATTTNNSASCAEFSGIASSNRVDQTAETATNAAASTVTVATGTITAQSSELAVSTVAAGSNTFSLTAADPASGADWTNLNYAENNQAAAYQIASAITKFSSTWGASSAADLDALIVTYKAATPGAPAVNLFPARVNEAALLPSPQLQGSLPVARVNVAAPAPSASLQLALPVAQVNVGALVPAGGLTLGLPVARVTVGAPVPSPSVTLNLPVAQEVIAALAPTVTTGAKALGVGAGGTATYTIPGGSVTWLQPGGAATGGQPGGSVS